MSEVRKVWVIVEFGNAGVKPVSLEAVHAARLLADSIQGTVEAFCLVSERLNPIDNLLHYGADRVLVLESSLFGTFSLGVWLKAIEPLIVDRKPY